MIKLEHPTCPHPTALETGDYKHKLNKEALSASISEKCMYCESKISHVDFGDVEHIKPKALFPELTCAWDNLGYSCTKCNNAKAEKYQAETPYINPYNENPEGHIFSSGAFLFPVEGSERGDLTILDINLNRKNLVEKRQARIQEIIKAVNQCFRTNNEVLRNAAIKSLKQEAESDKEYSLVVKTVLDKALLASNLAPTNNDTY